MLGTIFGILDDSAKVTCGEAQVTVVVNVPYQLHRIARVEMIPIIAGVFSAVCDGGIQSIDTRFQLDFHQPDKMIALLILQESFVGFDELIQKVLIGHYIAAVLFRGQLLHLPSLILFSKKRAA